MRESVNFFAYIINITGVIYNPYETLRLTSYFWSYLSFNLAAIWSGQHNNYDIINPLQ